MSESTRIRRDERFEVPSHAGRGDEGPAKQSLIRRPIFYLILAGFLGVSLLVIFWSSLIFQRNHNYGASTQTPTPTPTLTSRPTATPVRDARYYYERAVSLMKAPGADAEEIRRHFEKAIELKQDYFEALRDYGYFLFERKDYNRARVFLQKALPLCKSAEDEKAIQTRLAQIHEQMNR